MHTELTPDTVTVQPARFQCRHIKTDGLRCRSACLRNEPFCYFHHTTRVPIRNPRERKAALSKREAFDLHLIEDRSSIQLAIAQILQRIAANELDPRRAGLLLYGLQIASVNLPPIDRKALAKPDEPIEDTVDDEVHGTIAPAGEVTRPKGEMSLYDILTERWIEEDRLEQQEELLKAQSEEPPHLTDPQPGDLHNLNAAAQSEPLSSLSRRSLRPRSLSFAGRSIGKAPRSRQCRRAKSPSLPTLFAGQENREPEERNRGGPQLPGELRSTHILRQIFRS